MQEGDDGLSDKIASADSRPTQTTPHIAEEQPAEQPTEFRERFSAFPQRPRAKHRSAATAQPAAPQIPTANDGSADLTQPAPPQVPTGNHGSATTAQPTFPPVSTANDGSATAAQPDQHRDIQDLAEARRILTTHDPNTDPQAVKLFRRVDRLLRAMERTETNGKDYDQTRAMVSVRLEQAERHCHEKAPAIPIDSDPVPREPRMAFPEPNVPERPFLWTQKYWAYQHDVQKAKAVPLQDRPNRKPFMLKGPDKEMITYPKCQERQNLLRALQFDLLYMTYCLSRKTEKGMASQLQIADEEEMLQRLEAKRLIKNFDGNWNAISKVTDKVKVESMGKLGTTSSVFEECQKPTQRQFKPLKADDETNLRKLASNPQGKGPSFSKSRYDRLRGFLWYELDELDVLLKEFADEEASRADRTRTGNRTRALCELAQPLNLGSRPTEAKAKTLLSAQILHENIEYKKAGVIDRSQIWGFARGFEPARRQRRWFSMSKWLQRAPAPVRQDDRPPAIEGSLDDEAETSSSSCSSLSPPPDPYASQIPDGAQPYYGDAENRFEGRTPYDRPGSDDAATQSSSTQGPYEVGSGMLIPPEILGLDPRGGSMPADYGFTWSMGNRYVRRKAIPET